MTTIALAAGWAKRAESMDSYVLPNTPPSLFLHSLPKGLVLAQ